MLTIDALRQFGADTDEGMRRCLNNEAFYLKLVRMIPADSNFALLEESIAAGNLDRAFEAAHTLKGVLGNLSITPLFRLASDLTELLRVRKQMDYAPAVKEIMDLRAELEKICRD